MGELVNLRQVKKARAKAAAAALADANRQLHGRSKTARQTEFMRKRQAEAVLDNARLGHHPTRLSHPSDRDAR